MFSRADAWYTFDMETIKKLDEVDPHDRAVVERVFGRSLASAAKAVLILRTEEGSSTAPLEISQDDVPSWCNVLEGLSDEDLAQITVAFDAPVSFSEPGSSHGS